MTTEKKRDRPVFCIRPYPVRDESDVVALWKLTFADDPPWNEPGEVIRRKLSIQAELFLVCVASDRLAGTVLAGFDGVCGWIHKLAVLPDFQHQKIASRLMEEAERALAKMGCPKLNLQVRSTNAGVVGFYQSLGYSVEDRVSMGKRL